MLVLGFDAPGARNAERHDLLFTRAYTETLPAEVVRPTTHRVVDELEPIVQAHTIDGLLEPDRGDGDAAGGY